MKHMNKMFYIITLMLALSFVVSATGGASYIYEYPEENITVEFAEDSSFTHDIRQMIADSIVYDIPIAQTYSLCWLLGHDFYTESVSALYHKKSEYDPRCQYELYDVTKCTNCDYVYAVLSDSRYISCCPPEASAVSLD